MHGSNIVSCQISRTNTVEMQVMDHADSYVMVLRHLMFQWAQVQRIPDSLTCSVRRLQ